MKLVSIKQTLLNAALVAVLMTLIVLIRPHDTDAQAIDFQLTVRNITGRQPISPPIVVVHDSNAVLLPSNAERLAGLEEFAESGSQPDLMKSLSQRARVKRVARFGGVIQPQSQQTLIRITAEPGDHISVIGALQCTNDAITLGTAIVTDSDTPAFGSGTVWDVGTENNEESRATVPCLNGEGVSNPDTADGEGSIKRHPGLTGNGDLGAVFAWDHTVMEIIVDKLGTQPRRAFNVGATLDNQTIGQPITPPVVVVHDKNVDVLSYTRPRELQGIDRLSEGGDGSVLINTLAEVPGVVSVRQWHTGGVIAPGDSHSNNARAFIGTTISVIGMFACTNDGYIVVSADVDGSSFNLTNISSIATVFDSGSEDNDETAETVPCLGGPTAAFSEGVGENGRREHPGIAGTGDLDVVRHGWGANTTAKLTLHAAVEAESTPEPEPTAQSAMEPDPVETPDPMDSELPDTGGNALPANLVYILVFVGSLVMLVGIGITWFSYRRGHNRRS